MNLHGALKRSAIYTYKHVRSFAANVPFLRSTWHLAVAVVEFMRDPWRKPSYFDRYFATPDPWHYETGADHNRLLLAASMLKHVKQDKFQRALEIGCAEGIFTEMLSPSCEYLVAVDFAPTALLRASQRLSRTNVRFERCDLRRDPIHGSFDLITVMDVLSNIFRPLELKKIRQKLVNGLKPGGYLLLVDPRQDKLFETALWGRLLLRGGKNIHDFIGLHASLHLEIVDASETHVFALFRKESE